MISVSDLLSTERAIALVKDTFSSELSNNLSLIKISSPLAVLAGTGINDDLNGTERPVSFPIKSRSEQRAEVVHSLAKWKRIRLKELGIPSGKGILTDMRALRPDEDYSPLHSIYVDQWDWEKTIDPVQRNLSYLKKTVTEIYSALLQTEKTVERNYPEIKSSLPPAIKFIHTEELIARYPNLDAKQRENEIAKEFGAVFIIGIGGLLSNGERHDGRAPDYDDWSSANEDGFYGLNGDIIVWHPILKRAFELSSMGIRVDESALIKQLKDLSCEKRLEMSFHRQLSEGQLPQSIGGGIGQSRVCMFMLKKEHIGQVQVSIWPEEVRSQLLERGLQLL